MNLGNLAADGGRTIATKSLCKLTKSAWQPLGRLVDNHRSRVFGKEREARGPTLLRRQKAFEDEPVTG